MKTAVIVTAAVVAGVAFVLCDMEGRRQEFERNHAAYMERGDRAEAQRAMSGA